MYPKRKQQSNFICDPDLPWGPVYDSSLQDERFIINYKFVDFKPDLIDEDQEAFKTIQRLKKIFTQFRDRKN